jgi:hypothetical protein
MARDPSLPGFSSDDLSVVRHRPLLLALAALPFALALALVVAGLVAAPFWFALVPHSILFGAALLAYVLRRKPWPLVEKTRVTVGERTVEVGGSTYPIEAFSGGFVRPAWRPRVLLRRPRRLPVELELPDVASARTLLRALGLDVSQRVASFRAMSRAVSKHRYVAAVVGVFFATYGMLVAALAASKGHPAVVGAAAIGFLAGLVGLLVLLLAPTTVRVGADGLALRWLGRESFHGWGEVLRATVYDTGWGRSRQIGVRVDLASGEELRIPIGGVQWNEEDAAVLVERIAEAMEAYRSGDAAADAALLRRGDRPVGAWLRALRALGAGAHTDHRTAPVPRERLLRIAESPTAAASDRAAAAVALGAGLDDDARARLRRAAEASAAPKLRVAIEAAVDEARQAELEAAMAELDEAEAERTRRG